MSEEKLDKIAKFVAFNLAGIALTLVAVIATIALFGPKIAPLIK